MKASLLAALLGCLVGTGGTALGSALSFGLKKKQNDRFSSVMMGFSGGIMLAMVCLHMIPESMEMIGWLIAPWMLGGAALVAILSRVLEKKEKGRQNKLSMVGIFMACSIALHNFPEGLAMGAGLAIGDGKIGFELALLLLLHNIPEGLALAVPLRLSGEGKGKIFSIAAFAGLPIALGAFLGRWIAVKEAAMGGMMAVAAGTMLWLALEELIPEYKDSGHRSTLVLATVAGFVLSAVVILLV